MLKDIPTLTTKRFFEQLGQTAESDRFNKKMDQWDREEILDYYDEAIKKFYPSVKRDEMLARFQYYDEMTEEGWIFDFSALDEQKKIEK